MLILGDDVLDALRMKNQGQRKAKKVGSDEIDLLHRTVSNALHHTSSARTAGGRCCEVRGLQPSTLHEPRTCYYYCIDGGRS